MKIETRKTIYNNQEVTWVKLTNKLGLEVSLTSFGAGLVKVHYKEDLTFAPNDDVEFIESPYYFGKTVGRICGRIENSVMEINGVDYAFTANEGRHCLHSGPDGLSNKNWKTEILEEEDKVTVTFTYLSKDGEAGFPGNMTIKASYIVMNSELAFNIIHDVVSDQDTVVNLTNHGYFCLGEMVDLSYMTLKINANNYLTVDNELIVLQKEKVTGIFDFTKGDLIGNHLLPFANNKSCVDHDFVLNNDRFGPALVFTNPNNKLRLTVDTNYPILHIFINPDRPSLATYNALAIECKKSNIEDMMIRAFNHETFVVTYKIDQID